MLNQFLPTVPTFAVRETDVSQHNGERPLWGETSVSRTANVGTVGMNLLKFQGIEPCEETDNMFGLGDDILPIIGLGCL